MSYSKAQASFIPDGGVNDAIAAWHKAQPPRVQTTASPSTLTECPRVVWLKKHKVEPPIPLGWGKAQRMLLGRNFENKIAEQLKASGNLLWHWKDDVAGESVKFGMGEGLTRLEGTPDLLLDLGGKILVSDAKTSRADSFAYVGLIPETAFEDFLWYKYKLQIEAYYLLCHKNKDWFIDGDIIEKTSEYIHWRREPLPLPEASHLFSFALDDGIVRREFTWQPTRGTAEIILRLTKRWNAAYQSETMPECTCTENDTKFCHYVTRQEPTKSGYMLGVRCCDDSLNKVGG